MPRNKARSPTLGLDVAAAPGWHWFNSCKGKEDRFLPTPMFGSPQVVASSRVPPSTQKGVTCLGLDAHSPGFVDLLPALPTQLDQAGSVSNENLSCVVWIFHPKRTSAGDFHGGRVLRHFQIVVQTPVRSFREVVGGCSVSIMSAHLRSYVEAKDVLSSHAGRAKSLIIIMHDPGTDPLDKIYDKKCWQHPGALR